LLWTISDSIRQRVLANFTSTQHEELERFLARYLKSPLYASLPTKEYQTWATLKIASGIKLYFFNFEVETSSKKARRGTEYTEEDTKPTETIVFTKDPQPLQLKQSEPIRVHSFSFNVQEMAKCHGIIFYSSNPNEHLCDAAVINQDSLFLFQMTIGSTHKITTNALNKFIADAKLIGLKQVKLVFVVPQKSSFALSHSEFTKIQSENSIDVGTAVLELQPRGVTVLQEA